MYYTVYKITNLINEKIYIGFHQTTNLNDDYLGSGKIIRRAIKKYGSSNFKKEYIAIFDNAEEMYDLEKQLVNENFLKNEKVYNLNKGGNGGWFFINNDIELKRKIGKKGGSNGTRTQKIKACNSIPLEKKRKIGKKLGDTYGGYNKFSDDTINDRLKKIENINMAEYGWVSKVSKELGITHTQVKRFIKKYYKGQYYTRKKMHL